MCCWPNYLKLYKFNMLSTKLLQIYFIFVLYGGLSSATEVNIRSKRSTPTNLVDIAMFSDSSAPGKSFSVYVDSTMTRLIIEVKVDRSNPLAILTKPSGLPGPRQTLNGTGPVTATIDVAITSADYGIWKLTKFDANTWDVRIRGESNLDFSYQFLEDTGFFQVPITGDPIQGETYKTIITVPGYATIQSLDIINVFVIEKSTPSNMLFPTDKGGGKYEIAKLPMLDKHFMIGIQGKDQSGIFYRRMTVIKPIALILSVPSFAPGVKWFENTKLDIPFSVINKLKIDQDIDVRIQDTQGLTSFPMIISATVKPGENLTGKFVLNAGKLGITTTVTITAKPYLGRGQVSHGPSEVRQFTVESNQTTTTSTPTTTTSPSTSTSTTKSTSPPTTSTATTSPSRSTSTTKSTSLPTTLTTTSSPSRSTSTTKSTSLPTTSTTTTLSNTSTSTTKSTSLPTTSTTTSSPSTFTSTTKSTSLPTTSVTTSSPSTSTTTTKSTSLPTTSATTSSPSTSTTTTKSTSLPTTSPASSTKVTASSKRYSTSATTQRSTTKTVDIAMFSDSSAPGKSFSVYVDSTMMRLIIEVKVDRSNPVATLTEPSGITGPSPTLNGTASAGTVTATIDVAITAADYGIWKLIKLDANTWDVKIQGESPLDFSYQLLEGSLMQPITGDPIQDETYKTVITVVEYAEIQRVDMVMVFVPENSTPNKFLFPIINKGGGKYEIATLTMLDKDFMIGIQGKDKSGKFYRRIAVIKPIALILSVPSFAPGIKWYENTKLDIKFFVVNKLKTDQDIKVEIQDTQGLAEAPTTISATLKPGEKYTGKFLIRGAVTGVTTTVTITAKPDLGRGQDLHVGPSEVRQFTVERNDNTNISSSAFTSATSLTSSKAQLAPALSSASAKVITSTRVPASSLSATRKYLPTVSRVVTYGTGSKRKTIAPVQDKENTSEKGDFYAIITAIVSKHDMDTGKQSKKKQFTFSEHLEFSWH